MTPRLLEGEAGSGSREGGLVEPRVLQRLLYGEASGDVGGEEPFDECLCLERDTAPYGRLEAEFDLL